MNKNKIIIKLIGQKFNKNHIDRFNNENNDIFIKYINESQEKKETVETLLECEALILGNLKMKEELYNLYNSLFNDNIKIPVIALGKDLVEKGFMNVDKEFNNKIYSYFFFGGYDNYNNMFLSILNNLDINKKIYIKDPEETLYNGIIHPNTENVFSNLDSYLHWYNKEYENYVGILIHRSKWINNNLKVEEELIKKLEEKNIGVILAFGYSVAKTNSKILNFDDIVDNYFTKDNYLLIKLLINLQMLQPTKSNEEDVFDLAIKRYKKINIPILKPLISHRLRINAWENSNLGVIKENSNPYFDSEKTGMTENILIGCIDENEYLVPIIDRIEKFTSKINNYLKLINKDNKEKKITIMLNSNPCAGVENNLVSALGLQVWDSLIIFLNKLKHAGYMVEDIPTTGKEMLNLFLKNKAHSDFRWTNVEDIYIANRVLYSMSKDTYIKIFNKIPRENQKDIIDTWGESPGQSMVYKDNILITGINFGNVEVMIQPKRGCYGSKCTGEVCKILHDPKCPPTHQYIATYRYIEEIFKADSIIHFGAAGSLEKLPGKLTALSNNCYSEIVLGNLINFYIFNTSSTGKGLTAKRRINAILIDHLPTNYKSNLEYIELLEILDKYIGEINLEDEKVKKTRDNLETKLKVLNIKNINSDSKDLKYLKNIRENLEKDIQNIKIENNHILGQIPSLKDKISFIKEYLINNNDYIISLNENMDTLAFNKKIDKIIKEIINKTVTLENNELIDEIEYINSNLNRTYEEVDNLINALDGKFVIPGLSGLPSDNFINITPTGTNFYQVDTKKIPTKEAYMRGKVLANELINIYYNDNKILPTKVALSMISTDISSSEGEMLSQILYLIGIEPIWRKNGSINGLKVIPLEELKRPRIDVTVKISGVLRDTFPEVISLIDESIVLVNSLQEDTEDNYIKKYSIENAKNISKLGNCSQERKSTLRIFGNRPGSYGSGVDLALKSSAWEDKEDIVKTFVQFSSYAYGNDVYGERAEDIFIENLKNIDLSFEKNNNYRHNILKSSYSASIHSGISLSKEYLTGKKIKSYHARVDKNNIDISNMEDEINYILSQTILNPLWKADVISGGYNEANIIMKNFQSLFNFKSLTDNVSDEVINNFLKEYVFDKDMYNWFKEKNYYAFEEIVRRLMELYQRNLWNPDTEDLIKLRKLFLKIDGDLENQIENSSLEIQRNHIDVLSYKDVKNWEENLESISYLLEKNKRKEKK